MDATKQQYLSQIRSNTAYPTYRGIIGLITLLGYCLAGLNALTSLIMGFATMRNGFFTGLGVLLAGLLVSGLIFLVARMWKEAALILADIGDSVTEAHSKDAKL